MSYQSVQTCRKVIWVIVVHGCLIEAQVVSVFFSVMESERNSTNRCIDGFMLSPSLFLLWGVLLNYQLVTNLLLRRVSNSHILKTRPPKNKLFAQVCSIEESSKSFTSWPYLTSQGTRIGKTLKLKSHLNLKI